MNPGGNNVKRKSWVTKVSLLAACSAPLWVLAGCGGASNTGNNNASSTSSTDTSSKGPFHITIMTDGFQTTEPTPSSPVWKAIEKLTNTKMTINWVPNTNYDDKLNIALASGNLPDLVLVDSITSSIVKAANAGEFWDLGPYLKDYPNLSKANPIALQSSSINGKTYGIYRSRPLGRMAIIYRKDWLKNVGLPTPKTVQDFYNMLYAFTYKDPDKDGKNDTYGMVVTQYPGPWQAMEPWFGVPNQWGLKNGKLIPAAETPEYLNALNFFRKIYKEKLVNSDFAVMPPDDWNKPFEQGKAGVIVDVADRADQIVKEDPSLKGKIGEIGAIEGPDGKPKTLSTSGFAGMYVIPKTSVKTVAELKKVLSFLDKLDSKEGQTLLDDGVEGVNYKVVNGYAVPLHPNDPKYAAMLNDLNQLGVYIPEDDALTPPIDDTKKMVLATEKSNLKYLVANPAAGYFSPTYAQQGTQLDNILSDAMTKYIVGQTNEAGLKAALALWKKSGGDQVVKEINAAYAKDHNKGPQ
ncbi:MAG: extracellular solute-binding protein [Alicyclobacillus herbarius]|nr:extracellular solute-binding protein [Alicyclobacillus herbarius]